MAYHAHVLFMMDMTSTCGTPGILIAPAADDEDGAARHDS